MLFMRDENDPGHLWVNRGIDGRWDHFDPCNSCDTLAGYVEGPGETWSEPELCPSCIIDLAFESARQDREGVRPYCPMPGEFQQDDPALFGLERKPEGVGLRPVGGISGLHGDLQDPRPVEEELREAFRELWGPQSMVAPEPLMSCRDRDSETHLWLNDDLDGRATHFRACEPCDSRAGGERDRADIWSPLELCAPCRGDLALERRMQDSFAGRPFAGPVPDYAIETEPVTHPVYSSTPADASRYSIGAYFHDD